MKDRRGFLLALLGGSVIAAPIEAAPEPSGLTIGVATVGGSIQDSVPVEVVLNRVQVQRLRRYLDELES